ncbi:MAG: response regulator [Acetobacteraceae bacterium]|nr:response regulator [Acetobacteraceae bacterium]
MLARDMVQQVLVNLLMNAVKFTSVGTVELRAMGDASHLRFEIADTGPGIPAGKRTRLFREYDRLDASDGRTEGTGLGLSITDRFVRRMDGRIGHFENPGGGSVFWVELPISASPLAVAAMAGPVSQVTLPIPRSLRILLADDLDVTRAVTADFLRAAGHTVTEVEDGEQAVAAAGKRDFEVILTDMRMPIVDGLEATRRIRALPGHRGQIPIVLVTADLTARGRAAPGPAGADLCLMKPFTRAELLTAVEAAARLIPVPSPEGRNEAVLDEGLLAEFGQSPGERDGTTNIESALLRIEDLLDLLERPEASGSPEVRDAAHDLAGMAGLMGLTALAASLRRHNTGEDRAAATVGLRHAAVEAVLALRRHQETERIAGPVA